MAWHSCEKDKGKPHAPPLKSVLQIFSHMEAGCGVLSPRQILLRTFHGTDDLAEGMMCGPLTPWLQKLSFRFCGAQKECCDSCPWQREWKQSGVWEREWGDTCIHAVR